MPTVITGIARTPIGRFGGAFRPLAAVEARWGRHRRRAAAIRY